MIPKNRAETTYLNIFLSLKSGSFWVRAKIHPACHYDANGIKAGSNSKMTDKPAAECSKAANSDINQSACNV